METTPAVAWSPSAVQGAENTGYAYTCIQFSFSFTFIPSKYLFTEPEEETASKAILSSSNTQREQT